MKASLPETPRYGRNDLSKAEVELVALFRNLAEHRRNALLQEAQRRRDEDIVSQRGGGGASPQPAGKGPAFALFDLCIEEVSLINCLRAIPNLGCAEVLAELCRLQCEQFVEDRSAAV